MDKPQKPVKKMMIKSNANFDFNWVSKKVSLDLFNKWCEEVVPAGAVDVTLELKEDWNYDDVSTYLQVSWEVLGENPGYEKQMKKYQKDLAKWKVKHL